MTATDAVVHAKRQLRDEAKKRRAELSLADRTAAAASLAAQGLGFLPPDTPAKVVSAFLAIGEEINPVPLMSRLHREGATLGLPVMVGKGLPLAFRAWSPGAPLRTVVWGIREPEETAPLVEPDVLLMPLLAFDRSGMRLGYGGGFYDRTLCDLRARRSVLAIGLAFASQEVDEVPHLDYDERLDWVLTPEGPIRCKD
ncbi:MAG: 5-formyltetrahydrofolate cyclo-ligase [Hyphomicrobiaceae bacterium]